MSMSSTHVLPAAAAPSTTQNYASRYTSLAVLVLGAIALVVDNGYVVGPALLTLGGLFCLVRYRDLALTRADGPIIAVLVVFGLIHLMDMAIHQGGLPS